MRILLIEPYYGGSHKTWADELQRFSRHSIDLLTLPAQFWKWRMQGGAITLARQYQQIEQKPDLLLMTDMVNVATFRALTRTEVPIALYFHENQLSYPQNARQHHGWQYGFVNTISALAADTVLFSSQYHHDVFFEYLPRLLKHFGDYNELESIPAIRKKASVLPLAVDLRRFDAHRIDKAPGTPPLIVWNHRWEPDKNPALFFAALDKLMAADFDFRVAIVGENPRQRFADFDAIRQRLGDRVTHYGYVDSFTDYARLLWSADYVVSAAQQEFFGIAVAEAIYCGCVPILPHRLNYPYLVPADHHSICLYPGDKLSALLQNHLRGKFQPDFDTLRTRIARHDWTALIDHYDDTFANLIT